MSKYRTCLPQLGQITFLSDGGIETSLIYDDGLELPYFAAFDLLRNHEGYAALRRYYRRYISIARTKDAGFILESPTWRASPDWATRLDYSMEELDDLNRRAVSLMQELREEFEVPLSPIVISGCIGPRGDGYDPGAIMSAEEAERYHQRQIRTFADTNVDMVTAITMTNINEAVGIVNAAKAARVPVAISFTVETDGRLPTGEALALAINTVDTATERAPVYFMVNCAHPSHFTDVLEQDGAWTSRIKGVRANASRCSHAELDAMTELDPGNPGELALQYLELKNRLPGLRVLGGCCGTNQHHIEEISKLCI